MSTLSGEYNYIEQKMNIIYSLSDEYDTILAVYPENGEYDWYKELGDNQQLQNAKPIHGENIYELVNKSILAMIHEEDRDKFEQFYSEENIRSIVETGEMKTVESRWYFPKDNKYRWEYSKAVRMDGEDGKVFVVIGIIDVTEEKERQQELQQALSMAQSANRAKTTFLNNMSHDIRTPMNAIIGYTGLALSHIDETERVVDYLEKINQASSHLLSLINDVLDMSRIESGKISLEEKRESISEIVSGVRSIVQNDADNKNLDFFVDMFTLQDDLVYCDRLRLSQVILNVLSNSIKFTPEGGTVVFKIRQLESAKMGYGTYELSFEDTGMGIEKDFLKSIYEPFTRMKSSTVSGIQGTGLGMAITKNIIDMMGGSIDIMSEPDKGTIVTMVFDLKICDEEEKASAEELKEYDFTGKKVLVVEDNKLNREIAEEYLTDYGFIVDTAEDGIIAVEKMKDASKGDYDLVLMDVQMPLMDGYEATKQIRALGTDISKLPIIAMTANAFEEDRKLAFESGMNEHIPKPIDIENLKEVMSRFL